MIVCLLFTNSERNLSIHLNFFRWNRLPVYEIDIESFSRLFSPNISSIIRSEKSNESFNLRFVESQGCSSCEMLSPFEDSVPVAGQISFATDHHSTTRTLFAACTSARHLTSTHQRTDHFGHGKFPGTPRSGLLQEAFERQVNVGRVLRDWNFVESRVVRLGGRLSLGFLNGSQMFQIGFVS